MPFGNISDPLDPNLVTEFSILIIFDANSTLEFTLKIIEGVKI